MTSPTLQEAVNPDTGMTRSEIKQFVRNHFDEFVNRKDLNIGTVNFAPEFIDHGGDVPPGLPTGPTAPSSMSAAHTRNFPIFTSKFLISLPRSIRSSFAITGPGPRRPAEQSTNSLVS